MVNFISKKHPSLVEYIFLCFIPLKALDILQVSFFNVDHHHHKTKACSSLPLARNKWTKETLKYRSSSARATDSSRVTTPYNRFSFRIFIMINHKISFSYYAMRGFYYGANFSREILHKAIESKVSLWKARRTPCFDLFHHNDKFKL